ncbi:MAG TPA: HK97 gp10 family phage protein [Acidimicrobiia bacterium]
MARPKPGVRVVGQREFQKILKGLGDDAVDDIKRAHAAAAKIVEGEAKSLAPRHGATSVISGQPYWRTPSHSSGQLAGTVRSSGQRRGGFVRAGKKLVPYAGPVHFGWPSRPNVAKGWQGGPIRPNPFLYDALDKRREEVADAFARYIDDIRRNRGI